MKFSRKNTLSSAKNLLIFLPAILSNQSLSYTLVLDLFLGFLIFSIISQIVYITNNYTDRFIDKKNKLKKFQYVFKLKTVLVLNLIIFLIIIFLYTKNFAFDFLFLYVLLFYFYNFYLKKIKYIDIILLISFYLTRVAYGAEIININLTYEFFAFFVSIFSFLAIGKRIIQIKTNHLKNKNKIIPYNHKDLDNLKKIMNLLFWLSLTIFVTYGLKNYFDFDQAKINENNYLMTNNIIIFLLEFMIVFINFYRLKVKFENNEISEDIFFYVVKDKFLIASSILSLALLIFGA